MVDDIQNVFVTVRSHLTLLKQQQQHTHIEQCVHDDSVSSPIDTSHSSLIGPHVAAVQLLLLLRPRLYLRSALVIQQNYYSDQKKINT